MRVEKIRDPKNGAISQTKLPEQADLDWYQALWTALEMASLLSLGRALDITTFDGRVYQITGDKRLLGCYRRYPVLGTRDRIAEGGDEIVLALAQADTFRLFTGPGEGEEIAFNDLQTQVADWFGTKPA